jgi:signal peptidase I
VDTVRPRLRSLVEWVVVLVVAGGLATGTRAYAMQSYVIPSGSMTPTLQVGDRVIVDKLSGTVHRGDIVVFANHGVDPGGPPTLVKRVIGLPGEAISGTATHLLVDGRAVPQPWLPHPTGVCASPSRPIAPMVVPAGRYFVMGDCRGDSDDSRYWGTVPVGNIVGKVDAIVWRGGHPWFHWF